MAIAAGTSVVFALKKETTAGTLAGASGAQLLPRVDCDLGLKKDTYESNTKTTTFQVSDMRHGVRRVAGTLNANLAPGVFKLPMQSALRKDFVAGATTGALTNVTAAAGPPGTFTRAAGSYLSDGFKIGDVVYWTGWATTGAGNNSRNYRITALTALIMTVGTAATGAAAGAELVGAKASGDSVTCTVRGKKAHVPVASQTSDAYTIEKWFSDIAQSEQYTGCRFASMKVSLPATGLATVTFGIVGKDLGGTGTSVYFTSPTAIMTSTETAAVNGFLRVAGVDVATITGVEFTLDHGISGDPVVGSNTIPQLFYGLARVTGTFTAFFEDATLRDLFVNETESSINAVLTTNNTITADVMSFTMSRIKVGSADKSDVDLGIVQTFNFTGLLNTAGGAGIANENTVLSIQDSSI